MSPTQESTRDRAEERIPAMSEQEPRQQETQPRDESGDEARESQQRSIGVVLAVAALVVALLLLAIASGATGAFRP